MTDILNSRGLKGGHQSSFFLVKVAELGLTHSLIIKGVCILLCIVGPNPTFNIIKNKYESWNLL